MMRPRPKIKETAPRFMQVRRPKRKGPLRLFRRNESTTKEKPYRTVEAFVSRHIDLPKYGINTAFMSFQQAMDIVILSIIFILMVSSRYIAYRREKAQDKQRVNNYDFERQEENRRLMTMAKEEFIYTTISDRFMKKHREVIKLKGRARFRISDKEFAEVSKLYDERQNKTYGQILSDEHLSQFPSVSIAPLPLLSRPSKPVLPFSQKDIRKRFFLTRAWKYVVFQVGLNTRTYNQHIHKKAASIVCHLLDRMMLCYYCLCLRNLEAKTNFLKLEEAVQLTIKRPPSRNQFTNRCMSSIASYLAAPWVPGCHALLAVKSLNPPFDVESHPMYLLAARDQVDRRFRT